MPRLVRQTSWSSSQGRILVAIRKAIGCSQNPSRFKIYAIDKDCSINYCMSQQMQMLQISACKLLPNGVSKERDGKQQMNKPVHRNPGPHLNGGPMWAGMSFLGFVVLIEGGGHG